MISSGFPQDIKVSQALVHDELCRHLCCTMRYNVGHMLSVSSVCIVFAERVFASLATQACCDEDAVCVVVHAGSELFAPHHSQLCWVRQSCVWNTTGPPAYHTRVTGDLNNLSMASGLRAQLHR